MPTLSQEILEAEKRIRPLIRETMVYESQFFRDLSGAASVFFKCENLQHTGSFKARGSMNKILSLSEEERTKGIVTASSGNHGAGVANALGCVKGAQGIVFVPNHTEKSKVDTIKRLGAEVRYHGDDCAVAEVHARNYAKEHHMTFISPYNDLTIVAGQGTIGCELLRQVPKIDAVFVSVGGGGLIAGIATILKQHSPNIEIVGCQPENSQVMKKSIEAGGILDIPSGATFSDGTAGGIEMGSVTFPICQQLVDLWVTVTEEEIKSAFRDFLNVHHMLIEGSAAVPIASLLKEKEQFKNKHCVILLCGANIGTDLLKSVL